ncbi:MAG TPA: restriction endonuclease [Thermoanaerobaculia bacterium]|nr:restriction endonuclease [Thermoanaerobaculia bacterium]
MSTSLEAEQLKKAEERFAFRVWTSILVLGVLFGAIFGFLDRDWIGGVQGAFFGAFGGGAVAFVIGMLAAVGLVAAWNSISPKRRGFRRYQSALARFQFDSARLSALFWQSVRGRRFEQELAVVYSRLGYQVTLTSSSGDKGIDIMLQSGGETILVQCKAQRHPVGPGAVRELYGTLMAGSASRAILASPSGFTKGASEFAIGKRIQLLGLSAIVELHQKACAASGNQISA